MSSSAVSSSCSSSPFSSGNQTNQPNSCLDHSLRKDSNFDSVTHASYDRWNVNIRAGIRPLRLHYAHPSAPDMLSSLCLLSSSSPTNHTFLVIFFENVLLSEAGDVMLYISRRGEG